MTEGLEKVGGNVGVELVAGQYRYIAAADPVQCLGADKSRAAANCEACFPPWHCGKTCSCRCWKDLGKTRFLERLETLVHVVQYSLTPETSSGLK